MRRIFTSIALLCSGFFLQAQNQGFALNCKLTGFEDGTTFYLDDVTSGMGQLMDSAVIANGQVQFKGNLHEGIRKVWIRTKNFSDYKRFWLENNNMVFEAAKGKFRQASIRGSRTEDKEIALFSQLDVFDQKVDSLETLRRKDTSKLKHNLLKEHILTWKEAHKNKLIEFIKNNPQSIISANNLNIWGTTWGRGLTKNLFENLSAEMQNTAYGQHVKAYIELNKDIKVGDMFVDFRQEDLNGQPIKLSAYQGKVVLLDFWASWCGPCRIDNPRLVKIYQDYHDKGFEILGVALDTRKEHLAKAVSQDQLPWTNVSDYLGDKNRVALTYGISAIPDNFLIDQNGKIIAKGLRGDKLAAKLKELLP
jgi:thiol-disulfide isomerase/thioredoxin